jgi:hypothetical protein
VAVRLNVIDLGASRWRCVVFDDAGFAWSRTVSGTLVEGQAYGQGPVSAPGAEVVLRCVARIQTPIRGQVNLPVLTGGASD